MYARGISKTIIPLLDFSYVTHTSTLVNAGRNCLCLLEKLRSQTVAFRGTTLSLQRPHVSQPGQEVCWSEMPHNWTVSENFTSGKKAAPG